MVKIGGTLGKIGGKITEAVTSPQAANILTGGTYGAVKGAQAGDWAGAGSSIMTGGILGNSGIANPIGDATKGLSTMTGTQVNPADSSGYRQAANDLLDPVNQGYQDARGVVVSGGNVDPAFRNYQLRLAQQLQQQANGQGPSLAQMQLQQATDRTLNQSIGAIRAATGANAGLAARTAALAGAQQLGAAGNASAQLRLQEQQQAQNALAGLAADGRTGDAQIRGQDIQAQTAQGQLRMDALDGQAGLAKTKLGVEGQILGYTNDADLETSRNKNQRTNQIIGGIMGGASTAFGAG